MDEKFDKHNIKLMNEETRRKKDIEKATKREDNLQVQIVDLNKYNEDKTKGDYEKGQQDLNSSEYLNLEANFT